jgi:hypothetical protein
MKILSHHCRLFHSFSVSFADGDVKRDLNQRASHFRVFTPKISMTAAILATFLIIAPGPAAKSEFSPRDEILSCLPAFLIDFVALTASGPLPAARTLPAYQPSTHH